MTQVRAILQAVMTLPVHRNKKFLDHVINSQLFKDDSVPCSP